MFGAANGHARVDPHGGPPNGPAPSPAAAPAPAHAPAADPQQLLNLFGTFAPAGAAPGAPAPAPAPKPAVNKQLVDMLVSSSENFDAMGMGHTALLANVDPAVRQEVQAVLAAKAREHMVAQMAQSAELGDKVGMGHQAMLSAVDPALRKDVEAKIAEHAAIANYVSMAQTMDTQAKMGFGFGHDEAFKKLDPKVAQAAEHEMSVQRLLKNSGDDFNVKQITDELEHMSNPAERAAVLKEYEARTGKSLQTELHSHLDSDNYYRTATDQLLSDDRTKAEEKLADLAKSDPAAYKEKKRKAEEKARTLVSELSKSDPTKRVVFDTLGFSDDAGDTELIRQAFREIAPEQDGLFNRLNHSLSGDNEKEAIADLDMSGKRRLKQAAAGMRNAFTGRFHDNDRARMKDMLEKLSPDEVKELKDNPDEYGDILNDVQNTMHGNDRIIVDAYADGQKDLAVGLQMAEDISGNPTHMVNSADCDKMKDSALFGKLEKMKPEEREKAIKAYDMVALGMGQPGLEAQMKQRFDRDKDNYDQDRGVALLHGDIAKAKAALAMDAIDRKGTHIDDLEEAISDPDLDPSLATSSDPKKVKAHQEALDRRAQILKNVEAYGKGTLTQLAYDEDKLAVGKDNRVAFDDIMATGSVGFAMKVQRAIDKDDTEKGKELILNASDDELAQARKLFPTFQDKKDFDLAIRKEWGPTKLVGDGMTGYTEVIDADGDKNGNFIQMEAVLEHGERKKWDPRKRASVDRQAYDADREDPTMKEMLGETWAGGHYDYAIRREEYAADEGVTGEEFAFHAENTAAASEAYGAQKEADAESFMSHLKMLVNIVTLIVAPELLPLITPLMSAVAIGYKEHKLGKHYKGENDEIKGLGVDVALSLTSVVGEGLIGMRQASNVAKGVEALEGEARTAGTLVREAEGAAAGEAQVMSGVTKAHEAASEAETAAKEVIVAKSEAEEAAHVAEAAKGGGQAAGKGAELSVEVEDKIEKVKALAEKAAKNQRLALDMTKVAGDNVARGAIEGKSWDEIMKGVVLSEMGMGATKLAENVVGGVLDKLKPGGAAKVAGAAEQEAGEVGKEVASTPWHQTTTGRQAILGVAKSGASLPFDAAASGRDDYFDMFVEKAASEAASGAHDYLAEKKANTRADHAAEVGAEHLKEMAVAHHDETGGAAPAGAHGGEHGGGGGAHAEPDAEAKRQATEMLPTQVEDLHKPTRLEEEAANAPARPKYVPSAEEQHEIDAVRDLAPGDPQARLHEEAEELRRKHGGVLEVADARRLQARADERGVDAGALPKASTPEEVLLARGMTQAELDLYKDTLHADAQSHLGDAGIRDESKAQWRSYRDDHDQNITGEQRKPLSAAHIAATLKANVLLYQDFVEGATAVKVIPTGQVGAMLYGRGDRGLLKLGGDVGLARNSENMNASEKVQYLGLDYQGSDYVQGQGAGKTVHPDAARKLYQVEQKLTQEHVDAAKVVLGVDMYDHALGEAMRYQAMKEKDPSVEIPKLLELDEHGNLKHVAEPRIRDNAESPSTGMGYTASMGLRDQDGNPFFRPNQELTMGAKQFTQGAELATIDEDGNRKVVARYNAKEMRFDLVDGLSPDEVRDFDVMKSQQAQKMDKKDQDWSHQLED